MRHCGGLVPAGGFGALGCGCGSRRATTAPGRAALVTRLSSGLPCAPCARKTKTSPSVQEGSVAYSLREAQSPTLIEAIGANSSPSFRGPDRHTFEWTMPIAPVTPSVRSTREMIPRASSAVRAWTPTAIWARDVSWPVNSVKSLSIAWKSIWRAIAPVAATTMPLTARAAVPLLS